MLPCLSRDLSYAPGASRLRADMLRQGDWWTHAIRASLAALRDPTWWQVVPPTMRNANLVFKACAQVQANFHDLLITRCRAWPLRLVDLMAGDPHDLEVAVAEFLSAPECLLDGFSSEVRKRYPDFQSIQEPACQRFLFVVLKEISGTTFDIERAHSQHLRHKLNRQMTHALHLADLPLQHVGIVAAPVSKEVKMHGSRRATSDKEFGEAQGTSEKKKRGEEEETRTRRRSASISSLSVPELEGRRPARAVSTEGVCATV